MAVEKIRDWFAAFKNSEGFQKFISMIKTGYGSFKEWIKSTVDFKKAYENYGRHCIALYNPGWLGRPFNVYSYNVFDLEYDNTTYECVNTEKHWWGKSKHYYMSES